MQLFELIYVSTFSEEKCNPSEIARIIEVSQKNNPKNGITGVLAFGEDYFLQCIEGEPDSVDQLYKKILADPRHSHAVKLSGQEIDQRSFADWSMKGVLIIGHLQNKILKDIAPTGELNPYKMSAVSAKKLLLHLAFNT